MSFLFPCRVEKSYIFSLCTELVGENACTLRCILEIFASIHDNVLGEVHFEEVLVVGPMCSEELQHGRAKKGNDFQPPGSLSCVSSLIS